MTSARTLRPCPRSPNCVCTQGPHARRLLPPIPYACPPQEAMAVVVEALRATPRATLVAVEERYAHATVRTPVFRFVDDVEFLLDPDARLIHFRSASRVGWWDLGVNRRRMRALTQRLRDRLGS